MSAWRTRANYAGELGGTLLKIELQSGAIAHKFPWKIELNERDTHGFCGMGSTPSVVNGRVYFVGFNAKLYCLDAADLTLRWVTDLRNRDLAHNQPVQTFDPAGTRSPRTRPPRAGRRRSWSATGSISGSARAKTPTSTASCSASMPTAATWSGSSAPINTRAATSIGRTNCPRRWFAAWSRCRRISRSTKARR